MTSYYDNASLVSVAISVGWGGVETHDRTYLMVNTAATARTITATRSPATGPATAPTGAAPVGEGATVNERI